LRCGLEVLEIFYSSGATCCVVVAVVVVIFVVAVEREVTITPKKYFIQRLLNCDKRFASDATKVDDHLSSVMAMLKFQTKDTKKLQALSNFFGTMPLQEVKGGQSCICLDG